MSDKKQVKSKKRVRDVGEVFTDEREVNAMLDLVKNETERIDATFLEPACGDGNFLVEIVNRKLEVIRRRYGMARTKDKVSYEKALITAAGSVYGIDIMPDNVTACVNRLYKQFRNAYHQSFKGNWNEDVDKSVLYILKKNIICGNALTMQKSDGTPIVMSEWLNPSRSLFKETEYEYADIVDPNDAIATNEDDMGKSEQRLVYLPKPIRQHKMVPYTQLWKNESTE